MPLSRLRHPPLVVPLVALSLALYAWGTAPAG
jgi:hypothetical protein